MLVSRELGGCAGNLRLNHGSIVLDQECPTYGPQATIWPTRRFSPARKVSLYAAEMSKMIDLGLSGVFFQALKYAKTRFLPGTPLGELTRLSQTPWLAREGVTSSPFLSPLNTFSISISVCLAPD